MINSMTGYGKNETVDDQMTIIVEIRSLNSRFFDYTSKLSRALSRFDDEAYRLIKNKCFRGRFNLTASVVFNESVRSVPVINKVILHQYLDLIEEIKKESNLKGDVSIKDFLLLNDLIDHKPVFDEELLKERFIEGLKLAIDELLIMRQKEGDYLLKDFEERLDKISKDVGNIDRIRNSKKADVYLHYQEKISEILADCKIDENRIYQEAAILSEKRDISEEITRIMSHLDLFQSYLKGEIAQGKKLNFLLQELGREINTIGSKTDNFDISHIVVDVKDELEKIREQVQNVL